MKEKKEKLVKMALAIAIIVSALSLYVMPMKTYAYTSSNMPDGYRPMTWQDKGKTFGVDLETTIYFNTTFTSEPEFNFPILRLTDSLDREYYVSGIDYGEERPYTKGYAVYNEWQQPPLRYYYKELYYYDVMAEEGYWDTSEDVNPHYVVPNGYKIDLYFTQAIATLIWVKEKGGGKIIYSVPFVNVDDGRFGMDNKIPTLPSPEHESRYFVGWYYDSQYETRAMEGEDIPTSKIKSDGIDDFIILYGRWTVDYMSNWENTYRNVWTQEGYDQGFAIGRGIGQQEGYARAMDTFGSQEGGLYWLTNILTSIGAILAMEIFPSISVGLLVFIPFAFGLLFWFLKLLKGGGD